MSRIYKVAIVLGIRPDFIRTSKILKLLDSHKEVDLSVIHTGQHYDANLNDVFFKEMGIPKVTHQLDTKGKNHNEQHSKLIIQLSDVLEQIRPDCVVFLGDANATIGCIAPLKLGIPIAHIEAGMRSYDWEMPEERNRVIIDRVSDILYVYQDDYRVQLVQEGVDPSKIVVTGNVIVDVINEHIRKFHWRGDNGSPWTDKTVAGELVERGNYALMTLHRNEHMNKDRASQIIEAVGRATKKRELPVVLIEMPRLKALGIDYPSHFIVTPPLGYFEFGMLEANAAIEYTDSGTNQESASIFEVPCVVTRRCTERPECRKVNTTVLSGYTYIEEATRFVLRAKPNGEFSLGDGKSSQRIVTDLVGRLRRGFKHKYSGRGPVALSVNTFRSEHNSLL
jgi:UDP-N-acetylglucosamine 2-epimerase (non-hydrolysing)